MLENLIKNLYHYTKNILKFDIPAKIILKKSPKNAENILGKTGSYNPKTNTITIYVTNRHPKDILRSLCHELIHHYQKCTKKYDDSLFDKLSDPLYAQHDKKARELEKDAYLNGNIIFRDWEDSVKDLKR